MKFSQTLQAQSDPQWAPYNLDYIELKKLIKLYTTKKTCQGITIPGHADASLEKLEKVFQAELSHQYDRIDLFVKSKVGEINRRLQILHRKVFKLISRIADSTAQNLAITPLQRDKVIRYTTRIQRCIEDIKCLKKFVGAQRVAFHKILKKYTKCTGSTALMDYFHNEVFSNLKSFGRRDFDNLITQLSGLDKKLRAAHPQIDQIITQNATNWHSPPLSPSFLIPTTSPSQLQNKTEILSQQTYWNEYDHGSDAENEPYLVYINPESDSFPGAKTLANVFSKAKKPIIKVKEWLVPMPFTGEQKDLLGCDNNSSERPSDIYNEDDQVHIASSDLSKGYSTFNNRAFNTGNEKAKSHQDFWLRGFISFHVASLTLLLISWLLASSEMKKPRIGIDAGVTVGVLASLLFATIGFFLMYFRHERLSWTQRCYTCTAYFLTVLLNGLLLLLRGSY